MAAKGKMAHYDSLVLAQPAQYLDDHQMMMPPAADAASSMATVLLANARREAGGKRVGSSDYPAVAPGPVVSLPWGISRAATPRAARV